MRGRRERASASVYCCGQLFSRPRRKDRWRDDDAVLLGGPVPLMPTRWKPLAPKTPTCGAGDSSTHWARGFALKARHDCSRRVFRGRQSLPSASGSCRPTCASHPSIRSAPETSRIPTLMRWWRKEGSLRQSRLLSAFGTTPLPPPRCSTLVPGSAQFFLLLRAQP